VAARSKTQICVRSLVGILCSNPTGGKDISLLWVFCFQVEVSAWAVHSSRRVLPTVLCPMSVIAKPRKGRPWHGIGSKRQRGKKNQTRILILAITEELLAKFLYYFLFSFFLSLKSSTHSL